MGFSVSGPGPLPATTDRFMLDCIHANLHSPPVTTALYTVGMAAGYVTGDTAVRWTADDWTYIAGLRLIPVTIDQGFTGSPVPTANVRDVEQGAWTIAAAMDTAHWSAPRPTIYAARADMTTIVNDGWTRDIWLSWPMDHIPAKAEVLAAHPEYAKANLVGVQCGFAPEYDKSVIYDPSWPKTGDPVTTPKKPITTLPDGNFDGPVTLIGPAGGEQYIETWDPVTDKWTRVLWPVPRA